LLLLAACATPGYQIPAANLEFELSGRIAVRYRDDAGSGNIAWRHGAHADEMLLTTPMGQGIARIVRSGDEVVLTAQDGASSRRRTPNRSPSRCSASACRCWGWPTGYADVRARSGTRPRSSAATRLASWRSWSRPAGASSTSSTRATCRRASG
jgi:hypothetical protein